MEVSGTIIATYSAYNTVGKYRMMQYIAYHMQELNSDSDVIEKDMSKVHYPSFEMAVQLSERNMKGAKVDIQSYKFFLNKCNTQKCGLHSQHIKVKSLNETTHNKLDCVIIC